MKTRIGIAGYGNLGRGVEFAAAQNPDMELVAVFTRRDPESVKLQTEGVKVYPIAEAASHKEEIDVLILCGGSATDLPVQTPELAKNFNVIDSFDTHARIPEHFAACGHRRAKKDGHCRYHFCRLGSGTVLPEPSVCRVHSAERQDLYLLGQGCQPGPFGRDPPGSRSKDARSSTPIPVPEAVEAVRALRESGADHQTETHQRVLCRG